MKHLGNARDQIRGRDISYETAAKFGCDKMSRCRVPDEQIKHLFAIFNPASSRNRHAEHLLGTRIMLATGEEKLTVTNRPPGKTTRHGFDIRLGIATIDAEGVQFHQFTRIIFVGCLLAIQVIV